MLQGYLEKSRGKLKVVEKLLTSGDYEDSVSRAYYAAFHATQAVLLTEGLETSTHQGLVNLFGLHFIKTGKFERKYGKYLANLKDDRENGDYELYCSIDKETAQEAIREAQALVQAAQDYLSEFLK